MLYYNNMTMFYSSDNTINIVLSKEWWKDLLSFLNLSSTTSNIPMYIILALALFGFILIRFRLRIVKILFVIAMGLIELYYFGYYEPDPGWFFSLNVTWYMKLLACTIIVSTLTIQSKLTNDIFISDSLEGDQRKAAGGDICFVPALYYLLLLAIINFISWIGSNILAIIFGYPAFLSAYGLLIYYIIKIKHFGNISLFLICVSIISISGIFITMSYFIWTGVITVIVLLFAIRNEESEAYTAKIKAENGDINSFYNIGWYYLNGYGVPKDKHKAVEYLKKAADNGNAKAHNELAKCYLNGIGLTVDLQKAFEHAKKSWDMGYEKGKKTIGDIYYEQAKRYRYGKEEIGIIKDEQKAIGFYELSGKYGNAKAYNSLAMCYLLGKGVAKDGQKALVYAIKSYEMGNKNACETIGTYYRMGEFIPVDHVNGHKWDIIGAQYGNITCQTRIGIDFQNGYGTPENKREACKWYKMVADNKEASQKDRGMASYRYGVLIGILGDKTEGKYYIRQAQSLGNEIAIRYGNKYLNC